MLDQGDGLLVEAHRPGDILIGELAIEKQLDDLQVAEFQRLLQAVDQVGQGFRQGRFLSVILLVRPGVPARRLDRAWHDVQKIGRLFIRIAFPGILNQADAPCPGTTVTVDDFASHQSEEVGFQVAFAAVPADAPQERDEGFLHHVLRIGALRELGPGETQKPPLVAAHKIRPNLPIALPNPVYVILFSLGNAHSEFQV